MCISDLKFTSQYQNWVWNVELFFPEIVQKGLFWENKRARNVALQNNDLTRRAEYNRQIGRRAPAFRFLFRLFRREIILPEKRLSNVSGIIALRWLFWCQLGSLTKSGLNLKQKYFK